MKVPCPSNEFQILQSIGEYIVEQYTVDFVGALLECRWQMVKDTPVKGPWAPEEDALLKVLVEQYGSKKWCEIVSDPRTIPRDTSTSILSKDEKVVIDIDCLGIKHGQCSSV